MKNKTITLLFVFSYLSIYVLILSTSSGIVEKWIRLVWLILATVVMYVFRKKMTQGGLQISFGAILFSML